MIGFVAKNRLWNLRHDRAAMVLAFVVPIVFFSIFASIFGGSGRSTARRVRVAVVDEDGSDASKRFVEALRADPTLSLVDRTVSGGRDAGSSAPFTASSAEAAVRAGDFPVALVVPKGFGAVPLRFGSGDRPGVTLLADPSDPIAPEVVRGILQKTAAALAAPQEGGRPDPAIVEVTRRDVLGETKKNGMVPFYAAGLGVMFLLFSATGAGGALLEEVESGTLDRILSTRVNMTTLLGGKLLYLAGFGATQLLVMFVWGAIAFGLELSRHWAGFLMMTVCTAFATSAFGLFLASISRSRMQLVALSNLFVLVMSALGGSMYPRFLMPEAIQKVGLLTLNAWAIDGFLKVFWREEPVANLWPQVLVLCAIGTTLFLAARRIARRWEWDQS
jgi:ABC-2 type transport system permease protein